MKAKIIGLGSYLPEKILTNFDLEKMVDTSDEWIMTRTGVSERRLAAENEFTSDMGAKAARRALENANISVDQIDLILVATLTPDYIFPSTACLIQKELQAENAAAFDFQTACSGFIYGLSIAKAYIQSGCYKNVLLVASEKLSSIVDYQDRATCVLFGDGACAAIISNSDQAGFEIKSVTLGADGSGAEFLSIPGGGSRNPASIKTVEDRLHYIKMSGKEVFKHGVRRMQMASESALEKAKMEPSEISWLIPHQANLRILEAIVKRFTHIPENKIFRETMHKYGNTSASSVGIALDELVKRGAIKDSENILLTAFGAGFTWAGAVLTYKER